jgi:hypothetical protein
VSVVVLRNSYWFRGVADRLSNYALLICGVAFVGLSDKHL